MFLSPTPSQAQAQAQAQAPSPAPSSGSPAAALSWVLGLQRRIAAVVLGSAMLAAGVLVPSVTGSATGQSDGSVEPLLRLDSDVGGQLEPAQRLSAGGIEPPAEGMIAFPIAPADDCLVTDNYGDPRGSSRRHEGLDIMGSAGQPVYAVATGRLTNIYVDRGLTYGAGHGWTLEGYDDVVYKYFHLQNHEPGLAVGDVVQFGDIIGYVGNTGTSGVPSGTNYHLHFEVRPGNVPIDPRPRLVRPANCRFT